MRQFPGLTMDDTLGNEMSWPLKAQFKPVGCWTGRNGFVCEEHNESTMSGSKFGAADDDEMSSTQVGWSIPSSFIQDTSEQGLINGFISPLY